MNVDPLNLLWKLQLMQNEAARMLTVLFVKTYTQPLLHQLCWLPVEYQIQFKFMVSTFKALCGQRPEYLQNCLFHYVPCRPLNPTEQQ